MLLSQVFFARIKDVMIEVRSRSVYGQSKRRKETKRRSLRMNRLELEALLYKRNQISDWNVVRERYRPDSSVIDGVEAFHFYAAVDVASELLEGNIAISQQPYDSYIPYHIHNYIELTYVYQGSCTVEIQNKEIPLTKGSVILIDKDIPHRVHETAKSDIVMNIVLKMDYLSPAFLSRLSDQSIISSFLVDSLIDSRRRNRYLLFEAGKDHEQTINAMERIMCEYYDKKAYSQIIIDSYLIILFTEMIRSSESKLKAAKDQKDRLSYLLIDFLKYIEEHYQDCTLTGMAQHFSFHPNYLTDLLKQGTGKSFKELLQLQKLKRATLLLRNSGLPIEQIAGEIGYSSISFFYRKFSEIYGMTPVQFRKLNGPGGRH